jgi:long-chain fatty acid transport protein
MASLILAGLPHGAQAGGAYLTQIATPGSVGTAGVANVTNNFDPSAAVTQPAGLTGLKGDNWRVGAEALIPVNKFDSSIAEAGGGDGGNAGLAAMIPGVYLNKRLSEDWHFGFGIAGTAGGGLDYGKNFVGRYQAFRSVLQVASIVPSLAYKINDKVSIGAGLAALYTFFDEDIAINQGAAPDGRVSLNRLDDWSLQGKLGLTWQATDRAFFGLTYLTKSDVDLRGDLKIRGIKNPIINRTASGLDDVKLEFDLPQQVAAGLRYDASPSLTLFADANWEDWSDFGKNQITIKGEGPANNPVTVVDKIDRNFKDTWHVGVALKHTGDNGRIITGGVGYDSSPVDDKDRTFDLPFDEQVKLALAYGSEDTKGKRVNWSIGGSVIWMGDGKIDQTAQEVRTKGEFDTNLLWFISASAEYRF